MMKIETRAVHAGRRPEGGSRDVVPAIHLSTTFHKAEDGSLPGGYLYGRPNNPNREALEHALASLEEGAAALAFSSGSAATLAVFQALAPGDHVIAAEDAYYGTPILLRTVMANWGLNHTLVNMQDLSAVERAITPATRLIWTETPSNPLLNVTDLRAIVALAKKCGAIVACDNTWATPLFQQPLNLGVDVVMHSVTKYLSGHSDVTMGALVFRENGERENGGKNGGKENGGKENVGKENVRKENVRKEMDGKEKQPLFEKIVSLQHEGGAVPSPFECWLTLRGLQTFPYRVRAHAENAHRVAEFLSQQPKSKIEAVHYPGLPSHPSHKIAAAQMSGFGGMMSIQVKGGQKEAFKLVSALKLFSHATSLGSTHSLIEHRASVEGANTRSPANLLRLSIGLEHPDDLIDDLKNALTML